jgi:hypothetical protein
MAAKHAGSTEKTSLTTSASLIALATQLTGLVKAHTVDSRFASKLAKRLHKESENVLASSAVSKTEQKNLKKAFSALDDALRESDAELLVAANAALRQLDDEVIADRSKLS